jgi:hypothetical protein
MSTQSLVCEPSKREKVRPLRRVRSFVASKHGTDDESPRSGADVVEGIAGHQRQRPRGRRVQDRNVVRINHPRVLDAIDVLPLQRVELDHVTRSDALQKPSRCPAMPEFPSVPGRAVSSMWPTARSSARSSVPGNTGTSSRSFGIRSTASGAGDGSLTAFRQALTRSGDQRDWSDAPARCSTTRSARSARDRGASRSQPGCGTPPTLPGRQARMSSSFSRLSGEAGIVMFPWAKEPEAQSTLQTTCRARSKGSECHIHLAISLPAAGLPAIRWGSGPRRNGGRPKYRGLVKPQSSLAPRHTAMTATTEGGPQSRRTRTRRSITFERL